MREGIEASGEKRKELPRGVKSEKGKPPCYSSVTLYGGLEARD